MYIVVYDAPVGAHLSGSRFRRFKKFLNEKGIERLQYSTFLCRNEDTALQLAGKLYELMGGKISVRIFEIARERFYS